MTFTNFFLKNFPQNRICRYGIRILVQMNLSMCFSAFFFGIRQYFERRVKIFPEPKYPKWFPQPSKIDKILPLLDLPAFIQNQVIDELGHSWTTTVNISTSAIVFPANAIE